MGYHQSVLLSESIEGLEIDPDGIYVDATFGGGGHSKSILKKLKSGRLFGFDQDEDVLANLEFVENPLFTFVPVNFRYMQKYLRLNGVIYVDGVLADLGVSSHQIDTPVRGFSTRFDAELDMRMDQTTDLTAKKIINTYDATALQQIFGQYGEIRNAKTLAHAIVSARSHNPINTVFELKQSINHLVPKRYENKYLAQVFQALRIEVNQEMSALEALLQQSEDVIKVGGRLVVISYHSLEDRMVKNYTKTGKVKGAVEKDFFGNPLCPFKPVVKKPITASLLEQGSNSRSRSAKLRIAERI